MKRVPAELLPKSPPNVMLEQEEGGKRRRSWWWRRGMTRRRREESSEEACGLESATPGVSATSGLGLWGQAITVQ